MRKASPMNRLSLQQTCSRHLGRLREAYHREQRGRDVGQAPLCPGKAEARPARIHEHERHRIGGAGGERPTILGDHLVSVAVVGQISLRLNNRRSQRTLEHLPAQEEELYASDRNATCENRFFL